MPDIKRKVEDMRKTVLLLLVEAVKIYQGDSRTLENGQGRLANAYRTNSDLTIANSFVPASQNAGNSCLSPETRPENTALDTLAAAAHQQRLQETLESSTDKPRSNLVPRINGAQDVCLTAARAQSSLPYEAEPNAIASNRNITFGQTSQRSWQSFDPSWSRGPIAPETSYDGAMNPLLDEFSQVGMPNGESTMDIGTFWDDATYYDRLM